MSKYLGRGSARNNQTHGQGQGDGEDYSIGQKRKISDLGTNYQRSSNKQTVVKSKNPNRKHTRQLNQLQNMRTIEEERLNAGRYTQQTMREEMFLAPMQEQESETAFRSIARPGTSKDQMIELLGGLLNRKKINSSNSFQIPMINVLQNWDDPEMKKEEAWRKVTAGIGIDKRIYHFRAQRVQQQSYKILSEVNKNTKSDSKLPDDKSGNYNEQQLKQINEVNFDSKGFGRSTLETDLRNINLDKSTFELNVGTTPFIRKLKKQLESGKDKMLRIHKAQISTNLQLYFTKSSNQKLAPTPKHCESVLQTASHSFKNGQLPLLGNLRKFFHVFKRINRFLQLKEEYTYAELLRVIEKTDFPSEFPLNPEEEFSLPVDKMDMEDHPFNAEFNQLKQDVRNRNIDVQRLKKKESKIGEGIQAIIEDANQWMSATDNRVLKMPIVQRLQNKRNKEQDVNFDLQEEDMCIINAQNFQIDFNREPEQNFSLLPKNFAGSLDFLKLLSLRTQQQQEETNKQMLIYQEQEEAYGQTIDQIKETQNKKTFFSINQIKKDLYEFLLGEPEPREFTECFKKFVSSTKKHSQTSLPRFFTTICHLIAQHKVYMSEKKNKSEFGNEITKLNILIV